jgi:hypothetical protein
MMRSYRMKYTTLSAFALGLALAGVGCGDDDGGDSPPPPTDAGIDMPAIDMMPPDDSGPSTGAMIRVVHASPDAPPVDVYVMGQTTPVIDALTYSSTSPYLEVPAGSYTFEIRADGADPSSAPAFTTPALTLTAGKMYTAIAAGFLGGTGDEAFRVLALEEGFGTRTASQARVRAVHACGNAPTVAIDVGDDDPTMFEVPSLARYADTGPEGVVLPAGMPLQIGIYAAGATPAKVSAFSAAAPPADVFVIAAGDATQHPRLNTSFTLIAVGPSGTIAVLKQNPRIYAFHAGPDAPEVDVFVGPREVIPGFSYGELVGPLQVPPTMLPLDLFPAAAGSTRPSGMPAATLTTPMLAPGEIYLAVANGFLMPGDGEAPFQLLAFADGFALDDGENVRVRAIHGSPSAPAVTVGAVSGDPPAITTTLASDVSFPSATAAEGASLAPADYTVGFAAGATTSPVLASFRAPLSGAAGKRFFVMAHGDFAGVGERRPFGVVAIDTSVTPWEALPLPALPSP